MSLPYKLPSGRVVWLKVKPGELITDSDLIAIEAFIESLEDRSFKPLEDEKKS